MKKEEKINQKKDKIMLSNQVTPHLITLFFPSFPEAAKRNDLAAIARIYLILTLNRLLFLFISLEIK